ncbi:MAG: hypothetical protein KF764_18750 [Labilithrix sp.]|nr:hypothetical protein [Labilithrix sp.]
MTAQLVSAEATGDPVVVLTGPDSHHELTFGHGRPASDGSASGLLLGQSGLIYIRDPASSAEVQVQCLGGDRHSTFSDPGGLQVVCNVLERASKGGAVERDELVTLDGSGQKEIALGGATFWANLSNEPLEGGMFAVSVGWGKSGQERGIRQLVQFRSSGEQSLTVPNFLSGSMTGTASVVTPSGSEISFTCAAR